MQSTDGLASPVNLKCPVLVADLHQSDEAHTCQTAKQAVYA